MAPPGILDHTALCLTPLPIPLKVSCSLRSFSGQVATCMAKLLPGLMELVIALIIMTAITSSSVHIPFSWHGIQWAGGHPLTTGEVTDAAKIVSLCSTRWLQCAQSTFVAGQNFGNGVRSDATIHTINDIQRDFFLESALLVGEMTLNANLRDASPKLAFMKTSAVKLLPALTSSNTLNLLKHLGMSPNTEMSTSVATAAYLCGYAALPGEKMSCAVSASAVGRFTSSELGSRVHVLSTSNTPAVKATVTILDVAKSSVAEGKSIVLCHTLNFPWALYYCHHMTGTKVITATLKSAHGNSSNPIKAVGLCHIDTSLWLSTHPAFRALDIPHGDEACYWLVDSDVRFYPTASNAA